ncbi:MAG: hypothetical protein HY257_05545 [Chloroflexi bacterium]|nr:hypothetical protein [Chloroflexota bacterium]
MKDKATKKRFTELRLDFGKEVVITGMNLDKKGQLVFFDQNGNKLDPELIEAGIAYRRSSGKIKSLNRHKPDTKKIILNQAKALTKYNWLFAVDTNTKTNGADKISISVSINVNYSISNETWDAKIDKVDAIVFKNSIIPAELFGWMDLIHRIVNAPDYSKALSVGIITDYEIDKLNLYNSRKISLYQDKYLPENIEFIYASADTGMDFPANKLIRFCDNKAKEIFRTVDLSNFSSKPNKGFV